MRGKSERAVGHAVAVSFIRRIHLVGVEVRPPCRRIREMLDDAHLQERDDPPARHPAQRGAANAASELHFGAVVVLQFPATGCRMPPPSGGTVQTLFHARLRSLWACPRPATPTAPDPLPAP